MSTDLFSLFGNLLGGTASLPYQRSVSNNLPFQDALFNAFQNRQGLFSSSPTVSGVKQASTTLPFWQQLGGGGMAWSYDPDWMTGPPKPRPQGLAQVLGGGHGGGGNNGNGEVHGGPAQPPVELTGGFGPVSPTSPMPAPLGPNGSWRWEWNHEAPGTGSWVWINNTAEPINRDH